MKKKISLTIAGALMLTGLGAVVAVPASADVSGYNVVKNRTGIPIIMRDAGGQTIIASGTNKNMALQGRQYYVPSNCQFTLNPLSGRNRIIGTLYGKGKFYDQPFSKSASVKVTKYCR